MPARCCMIPCCMRPGTAGTAVSWEQSVGSSRYAVLHEQQAVSTGLHTSGARSCPRAGACPVQISLQTPAAGSDTDIGATKRYLGHWCVDNLHMHMRRTTARRQSCRCRPCSPSLHPAAFPELRRRTWEGRTQARLSSGTAKTLCIHIAAMYCWHVRTPVPSAYSLLLSQRVMHPAVHKLPLAAGRRMPPRQDRHTSGNCIVCTSP